MRADGQNPRGKPRFIIDPDEAYPEILEGLEACYDALPNPLPQDKAWLADVLPVTRNKYWLEVAYQIAKVDAQVAAGFNAEFHIRGGEGFKERWALKNHPGTDADVDRATKGREARQHYKNLRGFFPS